MQTFSQICHCGRAFSQTYAFTNHQRTCKKSKKRLSDALAKAQQVWQMRKRRRCISDAEVDVEVDSSIRRDATVHHTESDLVVPEPEIADVRCACACSCPHYNLNLHAASSRA
jgi:hypothetical protein